jgi:TolA-binding protein
MEPHLKQLGRALASEQEALLESFDHERLQQRFLLRAPREPARHRARFAVLAAAAAVAALALLLWPSSNEMLRFRVAGNLGRAGAWISAPESAPLPLDFSDGSRVLLDVRARARVAEVSEHGARVVLEHGALHAQVRHRSHTRWRVDAGPFQVHVVGTAFDVAWRNERFEVRLHEGSVRVEGPTLAAPRTIGAGERLDVDLRLAEASGTARAETAAVGTLAQAEPGANTPEAMPPPAASLQPTAASEAPAWRKLAAAGSFNEAFRALGPGGFERLLRSGDVGDLAQLAEVARLSAHVSEARRALLALRTRFPRTLDGSEAAFALGRLAFDRDDTPAEAARWFELYLKEQPRGSLRREATGRLLECYARLAATTRAEPVARWYLDTFPHGPHAPLARRLLATEPSVR